MSKQTEAKESQGYNPKPEPQTCAKCRRFSSKIETIKTIYGPYITEREIRCTLGGFKVKKTATCKMWERKEQ